MNDKLGGPWEPIKIMVTCTCENSVSIRVGMFSGKRFCLKQKTPSNRVKYLFKARDGSRLDRSGVPNSDHKLNAKATLSYVQ